MSIDLAKNISIVRAKIAIAANKTGRTAKDISIVAVSKQASPEAVATLAGMGCKDFGENRIQAGREKMAVVANDSLRWHLIGRIQSNKIAQISPFHLIHSLDRWTLAEKMSAYAVKKGICFPCLLQVNIAEDSAKAGIGLEEVDDFIEALGSLPGLSLKGLMTITAYGADPMQSFTWFRALADKFSALKTANLPKNAIMRWLSMGMSGDYEIAIAAGANMVRIGSAIFLEESGDNAQ